MKKLSTKTLLPIVGGILLIALGVMFLLNNLGIIMLEWEFLMGPLFAFGGLIFVLVFIFNRREWWALIPGFVLMGIGLIIFMGQLSSAAADQWSGSVFLGFLGLAFVLIYITHRDNWWAVIPGGVLLTLAVVSLLEDGGTLSGVVFFAGLALTFGLVYILPKPGGKLTWALYPAGILALIGVLVALGASNLTDFVLPLVLLLVGGYFIYRALKK